MSEDLIRRSDAIEAIKGLSTWWADSGGYYGEAQGPMEALLDPEDVVSALENIPSVNTDLNDRLARVQEALMKGDSK